MGARAGVVVAMIEAVPRMVHDAVLTQVLVLVVAAAAMSTEEGLAQSQAPMAAVPIPGTDPTRFPGRGDGAGSAREYTAARDPAPVISPPNLYPWVVSKSRTQAAIDTSQHESINHHWASINHTSSTPTSLPHR